jgi:hypothetical protein
MDINVVKGLAAAMRSQLDLLDAELADRPPSVRVVRAGENLQAALDAGGALEVEEGAQFEGSYVIPSGARLSGRPGSGLRGLTAPAILIMPGSRDIEIRGLDVTSKHPEVIRIGENSDRQKAVEDAPDRVTFTDVVVPQHRGKRVFAIHGRNVSLVECQALEAWDPAGADSQAIYIGNSPGGIVVSGGQYSAGSEVFLSGGDVTKIPNLTPTDILVERVTLFRPLSWKTDGVARKVKNIFEIKNGKNVVLRQSTLSGCWQDGQAGEAIVLTPALDGAKTSPPLRSGEVVNVSIEDVEIRDVSSVANMLGRAYSAYTVNPLSGVAFKNVRAFVNRAQFGGRGQFAIIQGEPADISVSDCTFVGDGSSTIYYASGTVIDPVTLQSRPAGKIGSLAVVRNTMTVGDYGFMFNGSANALNSAASVASLNVTGNTFGGPSYMKRNLPENQYVTRAELLAMVGAA